MNTSYEYLAKWLWASFKSEQGASRLEVALLLAFIVATLIATLLHFFG